MKYILMMHVPYGTGDYEAGAWLPEDLEAHMAYMMKLDEDLSETGELLGGEGLTPPGEARIVRASKNGPVVTDGPFLETKEFLAGYWLIDVESPERAYEIASRASAAPGPGGAPLQLAIEVRQVMEGTQGLDG